MEYDKRIIQLIGEYKYLDKYNNMHLSLDHKQINFEGVTGKKNRKELFSSSTNVLKTTDYYMKRFFKDKYNSPINGLNYKVKLRNSSYIFLTDNNKIINLKQHTHRIIIITCKIIIYSFNNKKNKQIRGWKIELQNINELL